MKNFYIPLVAVFAALILCSGLTAQETKGIIIGMVISDMDGKILPNVKVSAHSPRLMGETVSVSDKQGVFRLPALPAGDYELHFSYEDTGFASLIIQDIHLQWGQTLQLEVKFPFMRYLDEQIKRKEPITIDMNDTTWVQNISRDLFQTLPRGRDSGSLSKYLTGASDIQLLGGLSINGASSRENRLYADGAETTGLISGQDGLPVIFDFVDTVQFVSSGWQAEHSGSTGGVIQVVTRSGGNSFHGEVLGYYSGSALRGKGRNQLDKEYDPSLKQDIALYRPWEQVFGKSIDSHVEAGFTLGGAFIKDKLWFFTSLLPGYKNVRRDLTYPPSYYNKAETQRTWRRTEEWWNGMVKLTVRPFAQMMISAGLINRFHKYKGDLAHWKQNPDPAISYDVYGYSYPNFSASLAADWTPNDHFMLNLRGGYFQSNQTDPLVHPTEPYYRFQTDAPGGYYNTSQAGFDIPAEYQRPDGWRSAASYPTALVKDLQERFSLETNLTWFLELGGEHALKAGARFQRRGWDYDESAQYPIVSLYWNRNLFSGYPYDSLPFPPYGYYAVRGNEDTGPYGDIFKAYANDWSIYLQDSWTLGKRITLHLGLRAESETIPFFSDNPNFKDQRLIDFGFGDKLAPRFGFTWDPLKNSSLKIFGSYGIFSDPFKLDFADDSYRSFGQIKWKNAYYPLDTYKWTEIARPGWIYGEPIFIIDFGMPDYSGVDPDLKPMRQSEITLGAKKRLGDDFILSLRLIHRRLLQPGPETIYMPYPDLWVDILTNPGSSFHQQIWEKNKEYGLIPENAPDIPAAKRVYWGLNLLLEKQFSQNWTGGISYTWSRLSGNYTDRAAPDRTPNSSVAVACDSWLIYFDKEMKPIDGPLPGDRTHMIKVWGTYHLPFGLSMGASVYAMSGTPLTTQWLLNSSALNPYPWDSDAFDPMNDEPSVFMPYNRGDLGRTPFLCVANLYAEYSLTLSKKHSLQISLNIDNLFNAKTARSTFQVYAYAFGDDSEMPSIDREDYWIYVYRDPRFGKELDFYPPISAWLGMKFSF